MRAHRLRFIVFSLLLICLLFSCAMAQETYTEGDYTYVVSLGCAAITSYTGSDVNLIIPDTLGGYPVTRICLSAFQKCKTLETVYVPDSVISIGESVPDESGHVEPLTEYDSTSVIGWRCGTPIIRQAQQRSVFAGCSNLKQISLPANIPTIYKRAFFDCRANVYYRTSPEITMYTPAPEPPSKSVKPTRTPRAHEDIRFGE